VAAYSSLLGSKVNVQYRCAEILLSATGTFVGDSGRSIFLEQHLEQRGKRNYFRWEIPYPYIHHIEAVAEPQAAQPGDAVSPTTSSPEKAAAAAASDLGSSLGSILPLPQRPKTA